MKLYILRHAQRESTHTFHTQLTTQGHLSAQSSILHSIQSICPTHIYVSPFIRTIQTIQPFIQQHPQTSIIVEYALSELLSSHLGFEEKQINVEHPSPLLPNAPIGYYNPHQVQYTIETRSQMKTRVHDFLQWLINKHRESNDTILLVSHKGIISAILNWFDPSIIIDQPNFQFQMGELQHVTTTLV